MSRHFFFAPVSMSGYHRWTAGASQVGAASHKVAGMAAGLRSQGRRAVVVSSPIVTRERRRWGFGGRVCRDDGMACVYLPVVRMRGWNRLWSGLLYLWFAVRRIRADDTVVFYNFFPEYLLAAAWLRCRYGAERLIMDIEDGPRADEPGARARITRWSFRVLRRLCSPRAIVVSHQLAASLGVTDACVINGVALSGPALPPDFDGPVTFLYGGTIEAGTGLPIFVDAVRQIAREHPQLAARIRFLITGFGATEELEALAADVRLSGVVVDVRQDVGPTEYLAALRASQVGLSLRMPVSSLSATTFPSKVIEFAANGLLVLTTDVSDIGRIFDGATAVVLREATAQGLAAQMIAIAADPATHARVAAAGRTRVIERFSIAAIGRQLADFLVRPANGKRPVTELP
ncbi:hypothetical protein PTE30175_02133 [Pandoraea terrae]|uniref:Spore protein YkvP/CgeB glycosyl transferase-like domain-containing protein n=1 Tax=Pandoraea terrae TaxID=1537710 RepID=A0A5E4UVD6_9BURK|nr:glycosyltransferase family 4 protein [Pandoraea terrae]VVE02430.1 hypothetical protein PTE30175_02133 [Pandoraea terrae]